LQIALFDDSFALPMAERSRFEGRTCCLGAVSLGFLLTAVLVVYLDFLLMVVLCC
jgi:hypothetical protein